MVTWKTPSNLLISVKKSPVKNDDLLIKMAALAQRAMNSEGGESALGISDEEKQQLLDEISKFKSE